MAEPTAEEIRIALQRLRECGPTTSLRGVRDILQVIVAAAEGAAADRERADANEKDAALFRALEADEAMIESVDGDEDIPVRAYAASLSAAAATGGGKEE